MSYSEVTQCYIYTFFFNNYLPFIDVKTKAYKISAFQSKKIWYAMNPEMFNVFFFSEMFNVDGPSTL